MAKKVVRSRRQPARRETNWVVIGGVIAVGLVALFLLLLLALQSPASESTAVTDLAAYCRDNPDNCIIAGAADAPVTIVEVSDYACSHCRDFNLQTAPLMEADYIATGQVRWIVLPFALRTETMAPAAAALCAADQGLFAEFHHAVFQLQADLRAVINDDFRVVAEDVGLDRTEFDRCLRNRTYMGAVQANMEAARQVGVSGTPSFFVNGRKVEGNLPYPNFQQLIQSQLSS